MAVGFLWASFFEYALHRWLLHWSGSYPGEGHLLHHASVGMPHEPEYVNLGGKVVWVVLMFVINGGPVVAADLLGHPGMAPGMLVAFSLYFILTEEIHWRFHLGGWLPGFLRSARARHFAHHDRPLGDYGIFLPLFDHIFGTAS